MEMMKDIVAFSSKMTFDEKCIGTEHTVFLSLQSTTLSWMLLASAVCLFTTCMVTCRLLTCQHCLMAMSIAPGKYRLHQGARYTPSSNLQIVKL